jgi:hypothetical protein
VYQYIIILTSSLINTSSHINVYLGKEGKGGKDQGGKSEGGKG